MERQSANCFNLQIEIILIAVSYFTIFERHKESQIEINYFRYTNTVKSNSILNVGIIILGINLLAIVK